MKPRFRFNRVLQEVRRTFPHAKITSHKKLSGGLVSPTYKLRISKPSRILAVKIYTAKNAVLIRKNNDILTFLRKKHFPVPRIYSDRLFAKNGIVVMDFIQGRNAADVYDNGSSRVRRRLLQNAGKLLRKLHCLKIPPVWIHHKHEVRDVTAWILWTRKRVKKYVAFAKTNLEKKHYHFLSKELATFLRLLQKNIDFVPLHWDYHLSNLMAAPNGRILGLLDFDNAMKGHNLADLGIANYWFQFRYDNYKNFNHFLDGYGLPDQKERQLIRGYALLHLAAVTRSQWGKKQLQWLIHKHIQMLDRMMQE
ncbi:MAG: aminoglycoside phosphotransferase family protein [Candidatus Aenigmarchaeota archaeon]|nr:aminoglycoside phosphotransferase family protein [Candidatus Aenigmarchaeota archaeon]